MLPRSRAHAGRLWATRANQDRFWERVWGTRASQDRLWAPVETPRASQDRFWKPFGTRRTTQERSWAAILVDLGGPEGRFWKLLDAFSLERALSLEEATTCEKPAKTYGFYRFFSCPLLRARFEIRRKSIRKRVARQIVCETRFFSCWRPQNESQKS